MECALKKRREEVGLSIETAANATKIKKSFLSAIEDEDFARLPANVYTKGYIRQYAQFLDVPAEEIVAAYEQFIREKGKGPGKEAEAGDLIEKQLVTASRVPSLNLSKRALLVVTFLISLVGVYLALPPQREVPPTVEPPKAEVTQAAPAEQSPASPAQEGPLPAAVEDRRSESHTLRIVATDKVWVQVVIDGNEKREALLHPGDKVTYEAEESLVLKIGNAGGVVLTYNGRELEPPGTKGEVVRLSFPDSGILHNRQTVQESLGEGIVPSSEASPHESPARSSGQ
ncbi:MAG TPA: RodZ domain-containing protein [Dissulfurispiraceae bacterium]|nr:RodZ domain-containing protein [Dissulfurispiraceae bacterium]